MIISSSAAAIFFRRPFGSGQLSSAVRFDDRRQAYGIRKLKRIGSQGGRRGRNVCSAELVRDAPFAAAIGACVLTSLVAPIRSTVGEDEVGGAGMDSTDARLAVMAIIGFIPYFNWLSWVFAWLDASKQRYLVYSIVYLAPYLSFPRGCHRKSATYIASKSDSMLFYSIYKLETSIRNGDLDSFAFFDEALKLLPPFTGKKDPPFESNEKSSEGGSKKTRDRL